MESLAFATDATWLRFTLEVLAVLTISYCVYKQDAIQKWEEKHLHPLIKKGAKKLFSKYYDRKAEEEKILAEEARENEAWDEFLKELQ